MFIFVVSDLCKYEECNFLVHQVRSVMVHIIFGLITARLCEDSLYSPGPTAVHVGFGLSASLELSVCFCFSAMKISEPSHGKFCQRKPVKT